MAKKVLDQLAWIEDLVPVGSIRKPMFGGIGFYLDEKMILALFETTGDFTYKNKTLPYELWNGCLFPTDKENHEKIIQIFPQLFPHPILMKWLYLPSTTENFESYVEDIMKLIRKKSDLFGTIPNKKKTSSKNHKSKSKNIKTKFEKVSAKDMRVPRMFRDEDPKIILANAKKISDLKNLGPKSDEAFLKAGIKSAQQFIKMGWKKAMIALCKSNPKNKHSLFAYALIGALTNKEWNAISEDEKKEAREFTRAINTDQSKEKKKPKKSLRR